MMLRAFAAAVVVATFPVAAASQVATQLPAPLPPSDAAPQAAPPPAPPPVAAPTPAAPPPAMQPPPAAPLALTPPAPSRWRGSFTLGAGTSFGESYFMAGARLGYILTHGLAAELEGQYWMGATPEIGKLAPGITWYSPYRVYAGVYYARWFVGSGFPDSDAVGGRAGVTMGARGRASFGLGIAYERTLDCTKDCDAWWPEASVGVSF